MQKGGRRGNFVNHLQNYDLNLKDQRKKRSKSFQVNKHNFDIENTFQLKLSNVVLRFLCYTYIKKLI